jgi:putative membrane protein
MNKKLPFLAASISLAFVLAAPAVFAQTTASNQTNKATTHPITDAQFAKQAAEGGVAEVKLGQLAEEKGTSQQVKDFGKRMVDDHSKANEQLKSTASGDNIALPDQMNAKDQAEYDHLSKLSGATFDRAYARQMVLDHETDVAAFRHEANDGKDASIKSFASQTLPTLQDHLKVARQIYSGVSAGNHTTTGQKSHTGA